LTAAAASTATGATEAARAAQTRVRSQLHALARNDLALFCELVLRDERSGKPIRLGPHHRRFIDLVQREPRVDWQAAIGFGKSVMQQGLILWMLGRNPNSRCLYASATHGQAEKVVRAVRLYIENSVELRSIFPNLRPGPIWRDGALTVQRTGYAKDFSVQAVGARGAVLGARTDLLICDDVLTVLDASSEATRTATHAWITGQLFSRTTPGARVVLVGTPWHRDDLLCSLARSPGWALLKSPAIDPDTMLPTWPEQMPAERIAEMETQLGPFAAPRALHLIAHVDGESAFRQKWLADALELGRGREMPRFIPTIPPGVRIVAGLDLAMSLGPRADRTALAIIAVHPDHQREVVHLESFRGQIDVILARVDQALRNFRVGCLVVEAVQAQKFVSDLIKRQHPGVRVLPFVTVASGEKSIPFQANLLASELAAGRWSIPSGDGRHLHPEVRQLVTEILDWSPTEHCGDVLAALLFARSQADLGRAQVGRLNLLGR
jgi:hypothetical protein